MKKQILSLLSLGIVMSFVLAAPPAFAANVRVVATLTDLADFARNIGGDKVEVKSLATGVEDTHGVPMKPSFVPLLNRADLVLTVGFGMEHAFLPALLEASRNPRIQPGHAGYVDCSIGITPVDVPKSTDHSEGDVHPYGNPHYILDPVLAKTAIQNIYNALAAASPENQAEFARNRDTYLAKLDAKIAEWKEKAVPLKGIKFISYHEEWNYFTERFGMVYFGTVELKPGIDPTPRHIEELITSMKTEHVQIVIHDAQFPEKVPALIAEQTGAKLVTLPIMPGGVPQTDTYIEMMDTIIQKMVEAKG